MAGDETDVAAVQLVDTEQPLSVPLPSFEVASTERQPAAELPKGLSTLDSDQVAAMLTAMDVLGPRAADIIRCFKSFDLDGGMLAEASHEELLEICPDMAQLVAKKLVKKVQEFLRTGVPLDMINNSAVLSTSQVQRKSCCPELDEAKSSIINGHKYVHRQQLGEGDSKVWLAECVDEGGQISQFVVKKCTAAAAAREKEARELLGFEEHSKLFLKAFEFELDFVVLEYAPQTLQGRLMQGFFPVAEISVLALQLLRGLEELRSKELVHMDIKPVRA